MIKNIKKLILLTVIFLMIILNTKNEQFIDNENNKTNQYGVSSSNDIAVKVGMNIMKNGGNAVDAAIAISYVLGVVEPYASGIGGGGGMLVYSKNDNTSKFYDYREYAPKSNKDNTKYIGIPGFVKGMEYIHNIHGSLDMKKLLEPAIYYAEEGFILNQFLYNRLELSKNKLSKNKLPQYYKDNQTMEVGSKIVQKDLGKTLKIIKEKGSEAFYKGIIAQKLIEFTGWNKNDLNNYRVEQKNPIKSDFMEYEVITAPPPFSGITLVQILKLSEYMDIKNYESNKLDYIKKMSEIINITYNDRLKNIADPQFISKDYENMVKNEYIKTILNKSYNINGEYEHESTTHFVVIDKDGILVSCTNTLSDFFGSGEYIEGFFLNNTLSNFNYTNKKSINIYKAGKKPRTFMTPTIIKKENEFIMGIGSPGGNRIPQVISQVILNNLVFGNGLQESINDERLIFKNLYNVISESKLSEKEIKALNEKGYKVNTNKSRTYYGSIQALVQNSDGKVFGGADYRRNGSWDRN